MKLLLSSLFILCLYKDVAAQQIPQHPLVTSFNTMAGAGPLDHPFCRRVQTVYKPSEFPGAPAGLITHLYLRSASNSSTDAYYRNMTIKMAKMPSEGGKNVDTLLHTHPLKWYNTTGVFYSSSYTVHAPLDSGDWIQFPLQQPFYYDGVTNILVEMSHDSASFSPQGWIRTVQFDDDYRSYDVGCLPHFTSNWIGMAGPVRQVNIIGFDIQPNSIDNVQNISDLNIFPNPSQGIFSINFETKEKVRDVPITITSITGNTILQENHANIDGKFRRQIDLSGSPRGIDCAELKVDGERVTRKVVIQ